MENEKTLKLLMQNFPESDFLIVNLIKFDRTLINLYGHEKRHHFFYIDISGFGRYSNFPLRAPQLKCIKIRKLYCAFRYGECNSKLIHDVHKVSDKSSPCLLDFLFSFLFIFHIKYYIPLIFTQNFFCGDYCHY